MRSAELKQQVSVLRSFNRSFSQKMGLLDHAPYDPELSLLESRIVFELARDGSLRAKDLASRLSVNKGYLSRTLASLSRRKIIQYEPGGSDAREKWLTLSAKGQRLFEKIDRVSYERTARILSSREKNSGRVAELAAALQLRIDPNVPLRLEEVELRRLCSGDLGWVISRHGEIYFEEYGWNLDFEVLVAEIATAFAKKHDPGKERAWIAVARGNRVGCIFLVKESSEIAKLRILLVDPVARGIGLGTMLVKECVRFARSVGYKEITLWTNDVLVSARRIYEAEGFALKKEERHRSFGKNLIGQYWSKLL